MTDVSRRLIAFIESEKLTINGFERIVKSGNGFVKGTNEHMRRLTRQRIQEAFPQLNMDWIIHGRGKMILEQQPAQSSLAVDDTSYKTLISSIDKLITQNAIYAEALKLNAEALKLNAETNSKNAKSLETLISIIGNTRTDLK